MVETYKRHVPFEKFQQDGISFKIINRSDYISYNEFIQYFARITTITKHNLIIGINFTYGWMPTIFEFCSTKFEETINILNNAKDGKVPNLEELKVLKELLNNSLVGSSKLLHFINPSLFAIWDSRVYYYLTGKVAYVYRINDYKAYLSYLKFCDYLINNPDYENIHKLIISRVGYPMTKVRTAELIMYSSGGSKRSKLG